MLVDEVLTSGSIHELYDIWGSPLAVVMIPSGLQCKNFGSDLITNSQHLLVTAPNYKRQQGIRTQVEKIVLKDLVLQKGGDVQRHRDGLRILVKWWCDNVA